MLRVQTLLSYDMDRFYEKLTHRFYIAAVLKFLWKSDEHR